LSPADNFADLKRESHRIAALLYGIPKSERMKVFLQELEKLPEGARQFATNLVAIAVDLGREPINPSSIRRLIILVHGIRTRAEWQGRLRYLLEADGQTKVEPLGYGYFDVIRFLCPVMSRRGPVDEIEYKIRDALNLHDAYNELIFVGHSFGTYVLGTILKERPDIKPNRMLLCGSILSRKYRWDKLPNRPNGVLNEAGSRDIWPILARAMTWGFDSTGTFGFKTPGVRDRYHDCTHSEYFKPGFAEQYWLPWIINGELRESPFEIGNQPATPFFKNILELLPIKYVALALAGLAVWLLL